MDSQLSVPNMCIIIVFFIIITSLSISSFRFHSGIKIPPQTAGTSLHGHRLLVPAFMDTDCWYQPSWTQQGYMCQSVLRQL